MEVAQPNKNGAETARTASDKKPRHRSPAYPAEGLDAAVERARKLHAADRTAGTGIERAAELIGFNKPHGEARATIAALKKFGLVEMKGDRLVITRRAVDILLFKDQERGRNAAREAALAPEAYKGLVETYRKRGSFPSNETLKRELIADHGFNPNAVDGFLRGFDNTLTFAGLTRDSVLGSPSEEPKPDELGSGDEENRLESDANKAKEGQSASGSGQQVKTKTFTVALDPLASENPQFAQVLVPIPLNESQKKRLEDFIKAL